MRIGIATDHGGFWLKQELLMRLDTAGHEVVDFGAHELESGDDYPDFVSEAAKGVAKTPGTMGIVFGKSGAGECIVANKVKGIRCFLAINATGFVIHFHLGVF